MFVYYNTRIALLTLATICCSWIPTSGAAYVNECTPPLDLGDTSSTVCNKEGKKGVPGVVLLQKITHDNQIHPEGMDPTDMFHNVIQYDMTDHETKGPAGLVSFQIQPPKFVAPNNPTAALPVDMYVEYHVFGPFDEDTQTLFLDPACEAQLGSTPCDETTHIDPIHAACLEPKIGGLPFTVVRVLISAPSPGMFGSKTESDIKPFPNCEVPQTNPDNSQVVLIEYVFKILCDCPTEEEQG